MEVFEEIKISMEEKETICGLICGTGTEMVGYGDSCLQVL